MFRIAVFIVLLFAMAIGFAWLADNPGSVTVNWPWADTRMEISLMNAAIVVLAVSLVITLGWWVISGIINSPKTFGRWRAGRRRDKGYAALSKGLVAAGAGNAALAKRLGKESGKLLENEPLVALLDAQTALLDGDKTGARKQFETMLATDETRLLGLRGLYLEAEQEGEMEAAAHFAKEANTHTPGTPWATKAQMKVQTIRGEWEDAQRTLELARSTGVVDKEEYKRKKAVMLTAQAIEEEDSTPDKAKAHALAAHKLAPDLVPAALVASRVANRLNDKRKATKVLEAAWKKQPHPEIADTYVALKSAESPKDRLKQAEKLAKKNETSIESKFVVAKAAIDTGDFKKARDAMEIALKDGPTERACLIMADIEEAEHGDRGRVREWLSRAVSATRDPAWIADGVASRDWAPCSPVTGQLDAFEWKTPSEDLTASRNSLDYSRFVNEPLADLRNDDEPELKEITPIAAATVAAATTAATATIVEAEQSKADAADDKESDAVEDAEIIEVARDSSTQEKAVEAANDDVKESSEKDAASDSAENASVADAKPDVDPSSEKPDLKIVSSEEDKAPSEEAKSETAAAEEIVSSPFKTTNLDPDDDGVIDRRPDDPGIGDEQSKKKGWLF